MKKLKIILILPIFYFNFAWCQPPSSYSDGCPQIGTLKIVISQILERSGIKEFNIKTINTQGYHLELMNILFYLSEVNFCLDNNSNSHSVNIICISPKACILDGGNTPSYCQTLNFSSPKDAQEFLTSINCLKKVNIESKYSTVGDNTLDNCSCQ